MSTAVVGLETLSSQSPARTPLFVGSQDRYSNSKHKFTNTNSKQKIQFMNRNIIKLKTKKAPKNSLVRMTAISAGGSDREETVGNGA